MDTFAAPCPDLAENPPPASRRGPLAKLPAAVRLWEEAR